MTAAAASLRRIPAAVFGSLALHGTALGLYLYTVQLSRQQTRRVIGNVDLMIQVKKPTLLPKAEARAAAPPNMMNFLKMALPAIPKIEAQRLEVKLPQQHRLKLETPKLQDRGRRSDVAKLQALDLNERRPEIAKLDVGRLEAKRSAASLAALPKLEEVGRRRVKNLPDAIKLEEERQQAVGLQRMQALTTPTHRHVAPVAEALREAQPAQSGRFADKIAAMLPTQPPPLELKPEMRAADDTLKKRVVMDAAPRREAQEMQQETKKGIELEGPIKDRKIVSYDVPEFPSWARDQGILEAAVAIRFWVGPQGDVLDNMRVERTSGFGRLDRLSMDALKNWKFAPLPNNERQWGVITFRFVLE